MVEDPRHLMGGGSHGLRTAQLASDASVETAQMIVAPVDALGGLPEDARYAMLHVARLAPQNLPAAFPRVRADAQPTSEALVIGEGLPEIRAELRAQRMDGR